MAVLIVVAFAVAAILAVLTSDRQALIEVRELAPAAAEGQAVIA